MPRPKKAAEKAREALKKEFGPEKIYTKGEAEMMMGGLREELARTTDGARENYLKDEIEKIKARTK